LGSHLEILHDWGLIVCREQANVTEWLEMKFSIIIPNYNYGRFVGQAIASALAVEWPDLEVIVVDDGSTDNSREVIESFGKSIIAIFQPNGTQRVACNTGFARSTGDAVIFLDSDDVLMPSVAREAAAVWSEKVSKVQFQMMRIDGEGRPTGRVFPAYIPMPTPELIRAWVTETSAYPTPPGSGNVYARKFLERIFPLDEVCGAAADSACLSVAPFLGDVMTIPKPLVQYRLHGQNDSNLLTNYAHFGREVARAEARWKFARKTVRASGLCLSETSLFKSLHLLQLRVASLRVNPALHPLVNDSRWRAMRDTVQAVWSFPIGSIHGRMIIGGWALLTLVAPKSLALRLIALRFAQR
jgi:glycosyltransferase involved in cell wall biosynthesis